MTESPTFRVETHLMYRPVSGYDSMIAVAPDGIYHEVGDDRIINLPAVTQVVMRMSEQGASNLGEQLHHADWVLTSDPEVVRDKGQVHDCPSCRAGVDQALAHLREHPDAKMLVGLLYWAQVS